MLRADPVLQSRDLEIVEVLGEGGSAIVYRARDRRHARDVAVKVLRRQPAMDSAGERFTHEIRVAAGLRHAHILPLFDSGTLADGRLFAVMPVAQGRPLSAMIAEGPLTVADAVRLTREVAQALAYVHACGFVHRDVKPENILVESGHAVLTDFGVAASLHSLASASPEHAVDAQAPASGRHGRFTQAGRGVGTLHYMSPEALFADGPIDGRSDVFSLGVVLFEMLTGALPFEDSAPERLISRRLREGPRQARELRPDVSPELDTIVAHSTALDPAERFASAAAMDAALAAIEIDEGERGRLATRVERGVRSIGLLVVLVASIIGSAVWYRARLSSALDPQLVVVADLANDTGDSTLASIGALAGDFISAAIADSTSLSVVNATVALPSRLQRTLPSADSTLARATRALVSSSRAGVAVTGAYMRSGDSLDVVAEVTDTRSGRILGVAGPLRAAMMHPESALRSLGQDVIDMLRRRHAPPE